MPVVGNPGVCYRVAPSPSLHSTLLKPIRGSTSVSCAPSPAPAVSTYICTYPLNDALCIFHRYPFVGQTELTVTFLSEAVRVLTSGGRERSLALRGSAEGGSGGGRGLEAGDDKGVEGVLRELQTALSEEMALSVAMIRQDEEKAAAAAAGAANVSSAATQVARNGRKCCV